jgi:uncharacterized protein
MKPLQVVFDTSVLLSAIGWRGKPLQCLDLARSGQIQGVSCREIFEELASKLESKLDFTPEEVDETLADLLQTFALVTISGTLRAVLADPKDDMIIECAMVAGADYIVTGDRRHLLPIGLHQGIRLISPDTLLNVVAE